MPLPVCDLVHGMCGECLAGFPSICFGNVHVESTHEPPSELACRISVSLRRSSGAGSLVSHLPRCLLRAHAVQKLSHTIAGPLFCSLFHSFGVKSQDRPQKSGSALGHEKLGGHKQPLMALKHLTFRKLHAFSNTRLCFTSASFWCRTLAGRWGFVLIQLHFITNLNHARSIIHMSVLSQKAGLRLEVRCDVLHTWFAVG